MDENENSFVYSLPTAQPPSGWKYRLKSYAGAAIAAFRPDRARELANAENVSTLSRADRLMIAALVSRHERAGTLDELSALYRVYWVDAIAYHAWAEKFFKAWWLDTRADLVVPPLREAMTACGASLTTLCEIGCGNGLVLQDLSRRFTELDRLIGLDLSAPQMERNRSRFTDPRLRFESGDVTTWVPEHASSGWVFFSNNGVLEYISENQLNALFRVIAERMKPAVFALTEPVPDDYDFERETKSRPYNSEKSLGHNYIHWLTKNGWHIHFRHDEVFEGARCLTVVAWVS